jgi:predicted RNA methylase
VLGAGTGVLPLMAAAAGAGSVTAVERTRMLYRMARQVQSHAWLYVQLHLQPATCLLTRGCHLIGSNMLLSFVRCGKLMLLSLTLTASAWSTASCGPSV